MAGELTDVGVQARLDGDQLSVQLDDDTTLHLAHELNPAGVRRRLSREYVSFVLVEIRPGRGGPSFEARCHGVESLIAELDHASDVELRYGFHRIGLLVSDEANESLESFLLNLGAYGIRLAWRARAGEQGFARRALEAVSVAIRHRRVGKKALCLAAGGTTGIFFELGVLKCLQDCLPPGAINDMDMYFGISAGAVVGSLLAVGYSVDEFMAAVAGQTHTRMNPIDFRLIRRPNYNFGVASRRVLQAVFSGARTMQRVLRGKTSGSSDSLATEYRSLWAPPFTAEVLERYLRETFERPGASNRFEDLDRELYVGATDLDTRRHTLFGTKDAPPATISKAVQASVSFNPVFSPVRIGESFFEDGAVTRTSNMSEAIERDATLVLIIDPFLPHVSRQPGLHIGRSLFYHVDQNIRTMSYTRFANARKWVLRRHPEVSTYTFFPSNRQRRLLADNPMDSRHFTQIWRGAYLGTLAHLERCGPKLAGDLAAHGLDLSLDRARIVAAQLEETDNPELPDFYPQRLLDRHQPTLTLKRQKAPESRVLSAPTDGR